MVHLSTTTSELQYHKMNISIIQKNVDNLAALFSDKTLIKNGFVNVWIYLPEKSLSNLRG
jgi:hypothetical protein